MTSPIEVPRLYPDDEARQAALGADRKTADAPLPYADVREYQHGGQRQADLAAAERSNVARTAGELGLTTEEWYALRTQLGRSPSAGDIKSSFIRP